MLLPKKACTLSIILDEPVAYLGICNGSALIRGEVIVNFCQDTPIQGPIKLAFKGTQIVHPWFALTNRRQSPNKFIETTLHQIELSILLPNQQSIVPQGVQRLPFEFPIPGWLPITIHIPGRMSIFYSVSASLRESSKEESHTWMDWSRFDKKKTWSSTAYLRIVRAIETEPNIIPEPNYNNLDRPNSVEGQAQYPGEEVSSIQQEPSIHSRTGADDFYEVSNATPQAGDDASSNHSALSLYTLALDEQHDHLASSMGGLSVDNFNQPLSGCASHGVRYKLGISQTAIAIGTSLSVQVRVEPTESDITIRSVTVRISESRVYSIKVPSEFLVGKSPAQTLKATDRVSVLLKLGYRAAADEDDGASSDGGTMSALESSSMTSKKTKDSSAPVTAKRLSQKYHHYVNAAATAEVAAAAAASQTLVNCPKGYSPGERPLSWEQDYLVERSDDNDSDVAEALTCGKLINLKELDEPVHVGEYFDGSFVLPVSSCNSVLRPTMTHSSLSISHWLYLDVIVERNQKAYKLTMSSPTRLLDCRLVAHNDERQTILPPPPDYEEAKSSSYASMDTDIWTQRWSITQDASWGRSSQCPCQLKRLTNADRAAQVTNSPPRYSR